MLMKELREFLLQKLDRDLSPIEKRKIHIDFKYIVDVLSKEFEVPRSALFLIKDDQECPDSLLDYIHTM